MAAFLSPVVMFPLAAIALKVQEKNLISKGWTREQIEERRRQNQPTFDDDDDDESPWEREQRLNLQRSMQQYYDRENQRGRGGNV